MDHPATTKPYQGLLIATALCGGAVGATHCGGLLGLTEINIDQLGAGAGSVALTLGWIALTMWLWTGVFISAHDAMHGLVLPQNQGLNHKVGKICLGIYAMLPYDRMLKAHHAHHRHPSEPEDPDYWPQHWPSKLHNAFEPVGWFLGFMRNYFDWKSVLYFAAVFEGLHALAGIEKPVLLMMWICPVVLSTVQLFILEHGCRTAPACPMRVAVQPRQGAAIFPEWLSFLSCFHLAIIMSITTDQMFLGGRCPAPEESACALRVRPHSL